MIIPVPVGPRDASAARRSGVVVSIVSIVSIVLVVLAVLVAVLSQEHKLVGRPAAAVRRAGALCARFQDTRMRQGANPSTP